MLQMKNLNIRILISAILFWLVPFISMAQESHDSLSVRPCTATADGGVAGAQPDRVAPLSAAEGAAGLPRRARHRDGGVEPAGFRQGGHG